MADDGSRCTVHLLTLLPLPLAHAQRPRPQENELHAQQQLLLKEEIRRLGRAIERDAVAVAGGVDMEYLKNVVLKLLQTGEHEVLLPVLATLLKFSPAEVEVCRDTYVLRPLLAE